MSDQGRQIVDLLAASKSHYDGVSGHEAPSPLLHQAAEAAVGVIRTAFAGTDIDTTEERLEAILADLRDHPDELLFGESSRRPWDGEGARFEAAIAEHIAPLRDGHAVHLELGAHQSWPEPVVAAYVERERLGDCIRLDMNPEYPIDVAASVTALPFADETIDRIYSNSLFEHVAYPNEIIAEAYRVLRPGGVLLTAVPFHFTEHRVPADYLRFTGQFFEHAGADAGFGTVIADTKSCSGAYYTAHRLLKGACAVAPDDHPAARAAMLAHLTTLALLGCLRSMDHLFRTGCASLFTETRALAVKPGVYSPRQRRSGRDVPFVDRFLDDLICPATGLPMVREGEFLVSLDASHRYPIENGVPNLFVMHGFGSGYRRRASAAEELRRYRDRSAPEIDRVTYGGERNGMRWLEGGDRTPSAMAVPTT